MEKEKNPNEDFKDDKETWENPEITVLGLESTQGGGKRFVEGEPNPYGFGLYGS